MARPWVEVAADPNFQALAPDAQEQARSAYFQQNVLPNIPKDADARAIQLQFDQQTKPKQPTQATPETPQPPSLAMAPVGGAEMLAKGVTGAFASIPAGLAYGGAAVGKAFGADVDPANVQSKVQNYFTYQPQSASGQAGEQQLSNLARPVVEPIARKYGEATQAVSKASPFAGKLMEAAPGALQAASAVLPIAQGVNAARSAVALNAESKALAAAKPSPEAIALDKAKQLGLKTLPSQQGRTAGAIAEGLSGQAKLERSLSKKNAAAVDSAAAQEIGLPTGSRPTREALKPKKAEANLVYDEVAKIGKVQTDDSYRQAVANIDDRTGAGSFAEDTPPAVARLKQIYGGKQEFDSADAVTKVRQLRADAGKNIKAPNAPEQNALGYVQRNLAEILDDQMERAAQASGNADLVSRYRAARVQLAKIHSVEDAIRGQNISAKALSQQQKRGVKLSGKLKDIADSYDSFDRVLQDPSKIRDSGPLGVVDYMVGAGAALHNPLLATAALSRPIVRGVLASDRYQGIKRGPAGPVPKAPSNPLSPRVPLGAVGRGNGSRQETESRLGVIGARR